MALECVVDSEWNDVTGASLSKPHIDHDNDPRMQNNAIYLSMYHLPRICRTLVPECCRSQLHKLYLSAKGSPGSV